MKKDNKGTICLPSLVSNANVDSNPRLDFQFYRLLVVQLEKKEELRKEEERKKRLLASVHAKQNGRGVGGKTSSKASKKTDDSSSRDRDKSRRDRDRDREKGKSRVVRERTPKKDSSDTARETSKFLFDRFQVSVKAHCTSFLSV